MTSWSAVPQVAVGGRELDAVLRPQLGRVEVDERVGVPTRVVVTLHDPERDVLDRAGLGIGTALRVTAGRLGETPGETLADVEVVAVEVHWSERASEAVVVGYDVSHRLHRFRRTRSYEDVTDGDVLRTVAEEAGLEVGTVDDPGVVHPHLAQLNVTDWEFLSARARECGRLLRVRDGRIGLVAPEQATTAPEPGTLASREAGQLVVGANVETLRARVTSAEVPAEVEVRGWSPGTKEPVVATAPVTAAGTRIGVTPADLAGRVGSPVLTVADRPLTSQDDADVLAASVADAVGSGFASAHAVCHGDPGLRVGTAVSLGLAGSLVSGRWTVGAARHVFDTEGYRTTVELGGAGDPQVPAATGRGAQASLDGVVTGVVTDVDDGDDLARVRVSLPWLSDRYVSDWVRVVHPGGGHDRGLLLPAEVEDEVLVAFEGGDVRRPFVLGGLYNGQDPPPLEAGAVDRASGEVWQRGLVSRTGHRIVLDDGTSTPGIVVATGAGKVEVALDDATGDVRVTAGGDVSVTAAKVEVSARSIALTADVDLSVSAPNVTVEADSTLTLRGGVVRIN